jgi:uncharacterized protein
MPENAFHVPAVQTHMMASKYVDQTYQIQVMQPLVRKGDDTRFPVLYASEGNGIFDLAKGISHPLQGVGQVRRFILVGIGYPGENPFASSIVRGRDLTPESYPDIPGVPRSLPIEGVPGIANGKRLRGAADFLAFIRQELMPFIDQHYPTIPGDRGYFGHSLGGTLGLHALFFQPDLFKRYIISSPALAWEGDEHGIREAQQFIAAGKRVDARVFMSVAEQEEFEPFVSSGQLVSNFYRLGGMLLKAQPPGLELQTRVFPGETHVSVCTVAFSHGIRAVYGPAEGPVLGTPSWAKEPRARTDQAAKAAAEKAVAAHIA